MSRLTETRFIKIKEGKNKMEEWRDDHTERSRPTWAHLVDQRRNRTREVGAGATVGLEVGDVEAVRGGVGGSLLTRSDGENGRRAVDHGHSAHVGS